jgi:signal peptidase II
MLVLAISFSVAVLDQVTKHLVRSRLTLGEPVPVIDGLFSLTYVQNTGAAWGILAGLNNWLIVLSAAMLVFLVLFRRQFLTESLIHRWAAGLLIAGIVGNLVDRVRLGYVVDFLDFHWKTAARFPAFNIADAAICTGVGLYMLSQFTPHRQPAPGAAGDGPAGDGE